MAINNINNGLPKNPVDNGKVTQQNQTQQAQQQATAKTATAAPAPRQDSVSLTQSAQQLSQVQKKGTEAPIQSGDYQINPDVLASKIAKAESEIFGK